MPREVSRRDLLIGGATVVGALLAPTVPAAHHKLDKALAESALVYLTPLHADGRESSCQSEIWFAALEGDVYVVTEASTWRARAIGKGLEGARIWVGDLGNWRRTGGRYRNLPSYTAQASRVDDAERHAVVLESFAGKYVREWRPWGSRFRKGLADGSRVMLRYTN